MTLANHSRRSVAPQPNTSNRVSLGEIRLCVLLAAMAWFAFGTFAMAQTETDPVESGREALRDSHLYPWYDREKDDIRRVDVFAEEEKDPPPDNDDEDENAQNPTPAASGWGATIANLITVMFWLIIAILFGLLVYAVIWVFLKKKSQPAHRVVPKVVESSSDIDRVESLPFPVAKPTDDLLGEARRLYEAGNLREAIVYLFSYQLVHLDKNQMIHLTKGKTNRQYLTEIREYTPLQRLLQRTMIAFEDVFFGNHDLDPPRFEDCWQRVDEFHNLVAEGAPS